MDGWLALLPKILEEETGKAYRMTKAEADQIRQSGRIHGPIPVLAGIYQFTRRPEGFDGLFKPYSLFAGEADRWIDVAHKEAKEFVNYVRTVNPAREKDFLSELALAANAPVSEDEQRLLFHLWASTELDRDMLGLLVSENVKSDACRDPNNPKLLESR